MSSKDWDEITYPFPNCIYAVEAHWDRDKAATIFVDESRFIFQWNVSEI